MKFLKLSFKLINAKDNLISNTDMFGSIFSSQGSWALVVGPFISRPKTPYKEAHAQSL